MPNQILKTSTVVAAKGRVWCDMAGEAVILNTDSGVYYGLNPVGARVWQLIQEPRTVQDLLRTLLETYDVSADRCELELISLLQELATKDLIVIQADLYGANK
ncbi:MAG: PqqD family peptide modification chaperone [Deltaproteobacteria bacterium]|nr:PqqD family peptide modification chaperone [Deltaproteobacteria bacterium]